MNKNIGRIAVGILSAGILSATGAGYALAAPSSGSGEWFNSGGASGSGEAETIPDPMLLPYDGQSEVIFEEPWGAEEASTFVTPIKVQPVASTQENNAALDNFSKVTGAAVTVGGLAGTVAGGVIGCIVGGVVTSPTIVFIPAGCAAGVGVGAAVGGVVGTAIVGGPAAIATGVDLAQTYLAEPGTTHWKA